MPTLPMTYQSSTSVLVCLSHAHPKPQLHVGETTERKKNCYLNLSLTSAFHLNAGATKLFPSAIVPDIFQKLDYNANNKGYLQHWFIFAQKMVQD